MKFQLLAAAAVSFFAAATLALPSPQGTGPHGLIPDTDDWDAETDVLAARAPTPTAVPDVAVPDVGDFNFTGEFDSPLDKLLDQIDAIPDAVLEAGDDALHKYLVDHGIRAPDAKLRRDVSDEADFSAVVARSELEARTSVWKIAKCIAAIVKLLGTTAIPAAKLLRIKKYIKLLGGVKKAVKLLLKAKTRAQRLKLGGKALVNLAAELLGISSVKKNCF